MVRDSDGDIDQDTEDTHAPEHGSVRSRQAAPATGTGPPVR